MQHTKQIIERGNIKTIRFMQYDDSDKLVLEVTHGLEKFEAEVVQVIGEARLIASNEDPRIESYGRLVLQVARPAMGVFICHNGAGKYCQVIAQDASTASMLHPNGFEWDATAKQWQNEKGRLVGQKHFWPAPSEVIVQKIGDDPYAELEEVCYSWEVPITEK